MQQCQLEGKSRKIDGGRQREFTLLYILISAAKSNSQRPDSADRSQLHANFGKSYAYNTCDCPGLHLLRCVSQEQTSRDGWESVFRIQGQRSKRGNDGFLNPTVYQEILLMSFAQLALEWLFCALCIGHVSPNHLKLAVITQWCPETEKERGKKSSHLSLFHFSEKIVAPHNYAVIFSRIQTWLYSVTEMSVWTVWL